MGLKQSIQKEREKLKDATFSQKLEFFWDYYKFPAISLVIILMIIGSFIHSAVTSKDVVLSGICLNCYQSSFETYYDDLTADFLKKQDVNPSRYTIEINASMVFDPDNREAAEINYQSVQRIGAQITVGDLDFMIGNLDAMMDFVESGTFYDLSEVLTEEELAEYVPYLINREQSIPVLVDLSSCDALAEGYPYLQEPLVLGVAVNAPHVDMIREWISYLLGDI